MNKKRVLYSFLLIALIVALVVSFYSGMLSKVANWLQTGDINQTSSTSSTAIPLSTLTPNSPPVFNDPLNNKNNPNQWDTGAQGGATCSFVQGVSYHITAPARSGGGGCSPEAPNIHFTNFVYQIKMVIVQGSSTQLRAGPGFCWNPQVLGGSVYEVKFNTQGEWDFTILTGGNTGPAVYTPILNGKSQSFQTGTRQINYITVRVEKYHIDVQVNGKPLFPTIDDKQRLGGGGIGLGLNPGTENADVAFNDAKVWQL